MKKSIITILSVILLVSTVYAAGLLLQYKNDVTAAAVVATGAREIAKVYFLGDASENTTVARSLDFYDLAAVAAGISHTGYVGSITFVAGSYSSGEIFSGFLGNQWAYASAEGVEFATGIVVSPSANDAVPAGTLFLLYK